MNWLMLTSESQLNELHQRSFSDKNKGVLIFKHSTRCSISDVALNRLERGWSIASNNLPTYYLDLLQYRSLSSKIAIQYGIDHESPQVLVIKNGECIYSNSHSGISLTAIETHINN